MGGSIVTTPVFSGLLEKSERLVYLGSELSSGISPAITTDSTVPKPSNKASGEDGARYWPKIGKKEIREIIQGALVGGGMMAFMLWILWICGAYDTRHKKHNVKATGPQGPRGPIS